MSAIALRPFLPTDAPRCLAIFRDSIDELAREDYDEEQRKAWRSRADDALAFARALSDMLTLVASLDGESVGFASLEGASRLDMLYVDPANARRGVASALIDALCRLAQARGAERLSADVSDSARPLFERRGFIAERRNLVPIADQWLGNTTMTRTFATATAPAASTSRH